MIAQFNRVYTEQGVIKDPDRIGVNPSDVSRVTHVTMALGEECPDMPK